MTPRLADGSFFTSNPKKYMAFTEGSPWTYLFRVTRDVPGLVKPMGKRNFISKLDEDFSGGHYEYDNEPENLYPYVCDWVDQPWKSAKIFAEVVNTKYTDSPDGISGNDDCGQMSAWHILTTLGFYPVCPTSSKSAIGRFFSESHDALDNAGKEYLCHYHTRLFFEKHVSEDY